MNYLDKTGLTRLWSKITAKLGQKQDTLVSGTNIKTINNQSLLGSGNINISGGGGGGSATDVQINGTSITSNGVADIITESAYDDTNNKIATMDDVTGQGYQTATEVLNTINFVSQSQEFQTYIAQIVTNLLPSGTEITVNTFEDLPLLGVSEFTKAFVRYPSLYDVTTIADLNYDITQMHNASPVAEPDYSQILTSQDTFTIAYSDSFGKEFSIALMPGNQSGILLFGYSDTLGGSATSNTPMFVHTDGGMTGLNIPTGWSLVDSETLISVPVTFNEVPLIPAYLMTISQTAGNPLLIDNFFVDAKKHFAGEYRYINGAWRYQQTISTPFYENSYLTVPTSSVLFSTFNNGSESIATQITNLYNQVQELDREIHGGGE